MDIFRHTWMRVGIYSSILMKSFTVENFGETQISRERQFGTICDLEPKELDLKSKLNFKIKFKNRSFNKYLTLC